MKKSVILFAVLCGGMACAVVYLHRQKEVSIPPPEAASTAEVQTPPEKMTAPKRETTQMVSTNAIEPALIPAGGETKADIVTNSIGEAGKMVDALLSAKSGAEKHDLFQQLVKSGQIDAAIAELQQRQQQNPNDPEIPTTLGEALLNKVRALRESGAADYNQIGILAMQADQDFNAALKIDPQNWEAQFVKNVSMVNWPANPEVDNQVVQNLSRLIDQQETMPSRPEFAQTYVLLGSEYQKIGQPDRALATWQLGAQKFPNDTALQKKINSQ